MQKFFQFIKAFFYFLGRLIRRRVHALDPLKMSDREWIAFVKAHHIDQLPMLVRKDTFFRLLGMSERRKVQLTK